LSKPNAARAAGKFSIPGPESPCKSHNLIAAFMQIAVRAILLFYERNFLPAKFPRNFLSARGISLAQKTFEVRKTIKSNEQLGRALV